MAGFQERVSSTTGFSRMVNAAGRDGDAEFSASVRRRGFVPVKRYVRSARSTAASTANSSPVKTAGFQRYYSKFCNHNPKSIIDVRAGKGIKRAGAGSKNLILTKVASGARTTALQVAAGLNGLYAQHDMVEKGRASLYHKLSILAAAGAAGIGISRAISNTAGRISSNRSSGVQLNKFLDRVQAGTKDLPPRVTKYGRKVTSYLNASSDPAKLDRFAANFSGKSGAMNAAIIARRIHTPLATTLGGSMLLSSYKGLKAHD
jgi:hypothetical protein